MYAIRSYYAEVVVTNDSNKSISVELYDKLLTLLEQGIVIKQYADVYESATYRLPIHFDDKELYKFFPFSRSNQNKLYLFYTRFFDIVFSVLGLLGLFLLLPFIIMFNFIGNRGLV